MRSREPAGGELDGGKSAELSVRARTDGGPAGNTFGTVCGLPQLRYPNLAALYGGRMLSVGRRSLPTFYFAEYGGQAYEI